MTQATESVDPSAMLCARVIGKACRIAGLGTFHNGTLIPIDLCTALDVEHALAAGVVEVTVGVPHSPTQSSIGPTSGMPALRRKEAIQKWGREAIRKRADELLREKPSSFFAEKSPTDFAAEEVWAKESAKVEKERKRRQAAVDRLRAELPKRAEKLRAEAAERERLAKLAEAEAGRILAIDNEKSSELYSLKNRLQVHADELERAKDRTGSTLPDAAIWKNSAADVHKIRELVGSGVQAVNDHDAATLRQVVADLDDEFAKRPESIGATGIAGWS